MAPRHSLRRAAIAAVVVIVAAGAAAALRQAARGVLAQGERSAKDVLVATGAVSGRHGARREPNRPRLRRELRSPTDTDEPVTDVARGDELGRGRPRDTDRSGPIDGNVVSPADAVLVSAIDPIGRFAVKAVEDRDAATGESPVVAPGRPPELAFATFVAGGVAEVERVAELVGERRPELDDGVAVSLTGRVVEKEGGAPVAGARVLVTSTFYVRSYFYDHHLREVAHVESDSDGAFRIERLNVDPAHLGRGGRLYVTVTADHHAPALAVALAEVSPGVANRLPDVKLARATQVLRGRVLDQWEGRPVVGGRVYATGAVNPVTYPKDERAALFLGAPTATTDADGRFVLEGLGDGVQSISVHGGDDCVGVQAVLLPHEGEFTFHTRQIRGRIEGTTLDARGRPVALVTIDGGDNSTHSFADGHFVLENFRGDVVTISFTHPDYAPVVLSGVRDGAAGLIVRMDRPRRAVVLAVEDADTSAPLKHVQLAMAQRGTAETSLERLADDGRYTLRVTETAVAVYISAEGHRTEMIELGGRNDGEVVRVLLAPVSEK